MAGISKGERWRSRPANGEKHRSRVVRLFAQEGEQYSSPTRLTYRLPRGFDGNEDRVDLCQNITIVKRKHPASVAGIVVVKNSEAFDRLLGAQTTTPYVERDLCIHLP